MRSILIAMFLAAALPLASHAQAPPPPAPSLPPGAAPPLSVQLPGTPPRPPAETVPTLGVPDCRATTPMPPSATATPLPCDQVPARR